MNEIIALKICYLVKCGNEMWMRKKKGEHFSLIHEERGQLADIWFMMTVITKNLISFSLKTIKLAYHFLP